MRTAMPSTKTPRRLARRAGGIAKRWLCKRMETLRWRLQGCAAPPPPHIKRAVLRGHLRTNGFQVFVETGTEHGDTIAYLRPWCTEIHSIELSQAFFEKAVARFASDPKIYLWHGDSGDVMLELLKVINQPALFWLDGHYSGDGTARGAEDTPILRELKHISCHRFIGRHLVVVDDARCFGRDRGYPTVAELKDYALSVGFSQFDVDRDSFLIR